MEGVTWAYAYVGTPPSNTHTHKNTEAKSKSPSTSGSALCSQQAQNANVWEGAAVKLSSKLTLESIYLWGMKGLHLLDMFFKSSSAQLPSWPCPPPLHLVHNYTNAEPHLLLQWSSVANTCLETNAQNVWHPGVRQRTREGKTKQDPCKMGCFSFRPYHFILSHDCCLFHLLARERLQPTPALRWIQCRPATR